MNKRDAQPVEEIVLSKGDLTTGDNGMVAKIAVRNFNTKSIG